LSDQIEGELVCFVRRLPAEFKQLLIAPTSDVHYGNHFFAKGHFQAHKKAIAETPNLYTVFNGDMCESTIRSSKGDIFSQVGTPQDQRDWTIDQWYPIRHKVLAVDMGNHERRILNETGIDICHDIAKALGVPYRAEGFLLRIIFGSGNDSHPEKPYSYLGYFTHGFGGARTSAAKAVKVERTSTQVHADFYVMSHDHVVNAARAIYLWPDARTHTDADGFECSSMRAIEKVLVKSNAFLKWGGYSEAFGYPPVDLETPIIKLFGEKHAQNRRFVGHLGYNRTGGAWHWTSSRHGKSGGLSRKRRLTFKRRACSASGLPLVTCHPRQS
jgi:hypothetical protein